MDSKRMVDIQAERGAKGTVSEEVYKTIDVVISECRRYIQEHSDEYRNIEGDSKREAIKKLIIDFVMQYRYAVKDYTDGEGRLDTNKLIDRLVEDITDYGILTLAINDPDVYEIRCNGKELKVERKGRVVDLTDKDGKIVSFESVEQQEIIMRKLLGDVRLTPKDAVVNARTVEGYRIAAVHCSALGNDPNDASNDNYHAFVLRKFKKSQMTLSEIVKYHTLSDNMARLLSLATAGGLAFATVGPTSSGKTSTNSAILKTTPLDIRVVLLQNPSEIDLRIKDVSGRIINDVLHLEAKEIEEPTATDPTMPNLMAHILRLSPTLVCFGELRTNKEFALGMTILNAGHPINLTYHAEDATGAIQRFLTAHMAESGETIETALPNLTSKLNLIIVQKIMRDGTRKVLQITEVIGVDPNDKTKPLLNDLYVFQPIGEPVYDELGRVKEIPGVHKRVGKLSKKTLTKLKLEGIKESRFDFLLKEPSEDEVETYTGENIETYGMDSIKKANV